MTDAILDGAIFSNRTKFLGIDLSAVDFPFASLLQDLAVSQQRIRAFRATQALLLPSSLNGLVIMVVHLEDLLYVV